MGADIGSLVEGKKTSLEELSGKTFAVDAYNAIYQFLSSTRQPDGTPLMDSKGRVTGHLAGIFYRNSKLLENGIKIAYVFDGKPPDFKQKTIDERARIKEEAEDRWKEAKEKGDLENAKKYAQATSRLTKEMVEDSKKLLESMGIPVIQAPSEGEAQASQLAKENTVFAVASQDADCLLFGAPRFLKNLSITGKRKISKTGQYSIVEPELIELEELLKANNLTRQKLIWLGILAGTDFNSGIKGIGVKKGLKIVNEQNSLERIKKYVEVDLKSSFEEDIFAVEEFFLNPPVEKNLKLNFGIADKEKLLSLLCSSHDFSEERVSKTVDALIKKQEEKGKQSGLNNWFQ